MATFEEAVKAWADTINDWYSLDTTAGEVSRAFNEAFKDRTTFDDHGQDGTSYIETFFKCKDGSWSDGLDTSDREELADTIERLRGNDPLPTYADLGGNLLNVVPCRRSEIVDPFGQPEET